MMLLYVKYSVLFTIIYHDLNVQINQIFVFIPLFLYLFKCYADFWVDFMVSGTKITRILVTSYSGFIQTIM